MVRRLSMLTAVIAAMTGAAVVAPDARAAGTPIMALADVRPDMRCTVASVLRGTQVSSFDADVVDVVGPTRAGGGPRILVRLSGDAIEDTGVGPGFSGSPISCPDGEGVSRVVGAISEGVGDDDNLLALATPIEAILGEPVDVPSGAQPAAGRFGKRRRLGAWSVTGLPSRVLRAAIAAADRSGQHLSGVPSGPLTPFDPVDLVPGSAVATSIAAGDISLSAIGTVAYRDGASVWAFGHPLDEAGARGLFLQDAYVYGVAKTLGAAGGSSKIAAPGHVLGTFANDAPDAVVGRLGVLPRSIPLTVVARDSDRNRTTTVRTAVADETALGDPAGPSALRFTGMLAVLAGARGALRGLPARQSGRMCLDIALEGAPSIGFCNAYVIDDASAAEGDPFSAPGEALAGLAAADFDAAIALVDARIFPGLRVRSVTMHLDIRRGLAQAQILDASAPRRVRAGEPFEVRLRVREVRGPVWKHVARLRLPRTVPAGSYDLAVTGTPADRGGFLGALFDRVFSEHRESSPPRSLADLARRVRGIRRRHGLVARLVRRQRQRLTIPMASSTSVRLSGGTHLPIVVLPALRRGHAR